MPHCPTKLLKKVALYFTLILVGIACAPRALAHTDNFTSGVLKIKVTTSPGHATGGTAWEVRAPNGKQYTITNAHVCGQFPSMDAFSESRNQEFPGLKVIDMDRENDICVLEGVPQVRPFQLGDSPYPNEVVEILGHPGLQRQTWSKGLITDSLAGEARSTAPVFPGSSGSPAFDRDGYVMGMVSAYQLSDGHSIMIVADTLRGFLKSLK